MPGQKARGVPNRDGGANLEETAVERAMEHLEMREFPRIAEKTPAALRVLVVDDEPLIRWSVAETLTDRGYEVVETGDASGARSAVADESGHFDVVLLDYRLPDSDDLNLLASIRRESPEAQVILMTAFGRPEVVRGALELGAYRVVNKPFEMQAIADLVAQAHLAGSRHENH
jgi:DNA-binding NtrC family response regulator